MRIRSIKPEFWRSEDITQLAFPDRLLFVGLWSYVDDNGVGIDDFRAIAADLFALEDDQNEVRTFIREGLATLSRVLLVARYEVESRRFIYITSWDRHQRVDRPNKARYPRPDPGRTTATSGNERSHDDLATVSRLPRETPSPGAVEQGSSGTGEQKKNPRPPRANETAPDGFDDFWAAYPKKVGKLAASKAYATAVKRGAEPAELLTAARRYAALVASADPRFTAHPTTWLNQGRHEDEHPAPGTAVAVGQGPRRVATTTQRVQDALSLLDPEGD